MTVGFFSEQIGTSGNNFFNQTIGRISYGLQGNDSFSFDSSTSASREENAVFVGGSGSDTYTISGSNTTAIIYDGSNSSGDTLVFLGETANAGIAMIDNRHLYFGAVDLGQYALILDWQSPNNRIETLLFDGGTLSYEEYSSLILQATQDPLVARTIGYSGNFTWDQAIALDEIDLASVGLSPSTINSAIEQVQARAEILESPQLGKDFNADGRKDILWSNRNTGALAYWSISELNNSPSSIVADFLSTESLEGLDVIGTVDFNRDGQSDILVRDTAQDINKILILNGTSQTSSITIGANFPIANPAWRMRAVGNFDSDSETEILWRNQETGGFVLWNINSSNEATATFVDISAIGLGASGVLSNLSWEIQATKDINGDGRDEIFWRNTATGGNAIWSLNDSGGVSSSVFTTQFASLDWNILDVEDYNQDGTVDIAWRNRVTGENLIWTMGQTAEGFMRTSSNFIPSLNPEIWFGVSQ